MPPLQSSLDLRPLDTLSSSVTLAQNNEGQRFYQVNHPLGTALIAEQGAHLVSFIPKGQPDWLWVSQDSLYQAGKAIRGGVPICWPWFGKQATPSHGFARISNWTLVSVTEDETQVTFRFLLTDADVDQAPFAFRLTYEVTLGESLELVLTTQNSGQAPIGITGALHTYFAAARDQLSVQGLADHYTDSTRDGLACNEDSFALAPETDRIYPDTDAQVVLDSGQQRLAIAQAGGDSVVVWNAGKALVDSMADMHPGAEQEYLCIEAAITGTPVEVAPGKQAILSQRIERI